MALINTDVMIQSKLDIEKTLNKMEELNEQLLADCNKFATIVQDDVVTSTKEMVQKISLILKDIREKATNQIEKMAKAAGGIGVLESRASDDIKSIR